MDTKLKNKKKLKRIKRIRRKVSGSEECPRLVVNKSLNHIYAQLVDDVNGRILAAASTLSQEIKKDKGKKTKVEEAKLVGHLIAKIGLEKGFKTVAFDRHGYKYHGRIKALADAAREEGLNF
ncbi:50S ribosomal protein L18 [bacterium]|nr:50S ribosomal protein L18 [bacterium]